MDNQNLIYDDKMDGLRTFYNRIYALVGLGILTSAAVAFITIRFFLTNILALLSGGTMVIWLLMIGTIVLMFPMQAAASKNSPAAMPLFFVFSAVWGFMLSITLLAFTMTDITLAFGTASGMFFALSAYGRLTKRDLSGMRKALIAGLIGLLIAMVLNIFIGGTMVQLGISVIGVLLFSGFIAYDNNKIRQVYMAMNGQVQDGWAVSMALSLYLDFINLFMFLLQIFGGAGGSRK
ncbi:MAG: Bax inhibitor-1/YccA family protein [Streptococcaceae bacterium]|jgi:FtsH-binding integral membrane protein|nr:Bax inhibitor-1/YccA family protein [Streptococcaceae bacterium]